MNDVADYVLTNNNIHLLLLQDDITALMVAACVGHLAVVEVLIKAGATIDLQNTVCI